MDTYKHVKYEELKIGDIVGWTQSNKVPGVSRYVVTRLYNPTNNTIGFKSLEDGYTWSAYMVAGTEDRLILWQTLSKEDKILNKIKYLDKRFNERKLQSG